MIVEASHLPLSIIIVGMGENEFSFMNVLDGDEDSLSYNNHQCVRDVMTVYDFDDE